MTSVIASRKRAGLRALLADDGFTLVEMLVGIAAGMFVVMAAYAAMTAASVEQTRTAGRIEAAQRGRAAIDTITRDIRAQMCLPTQSGYNSAPQPAMITASGDVAQFYASVAPPAKGAGSNPPVTPGATAPPEMRRLEWVANGGSVTMNNQDSSALPIGHIDETVWRATNTTPPYSFPATPTKKMTIAKDVEHSRDASGNVLPIFQYYGYNIVNGVGRPSSTPLTSGGTPVATADLGKVVLVAINFSARPIGEKITSARSGTATRQTPVVPFYNKVSVRIADPTDPNVNPLCMQ